MRKTLDWLALLALGWLAPLAVAAVVPISEVPAVLSPPWIFVLFTASIVAVLVLRIPQIRRGLRWYRASQRVVRETERAEKCHQQERAAKKAAFFDDLAGIVRITNVTAVPQTGTLSFSLRPRRTPKRQLVRAVVWLANRPWWVERPITERILRSIIRRLGA